MRHLRLLAIAPVLFAAAFIATPTHAQSNTQNGLVNVNLQNISLAIPVSAAVPIGIAANVCGVNVLAIQQANNTCTATSNSMALSDAIAGAMTGTGTGPGGASNNQSGLVNVNIQNLALAVPVSVALPISAAVNACGVSVLAIQQAGNTCSATSATDAVSRAIAHALAGTGA